MHSFKALVTALAGCVAMTAAARAADMPEVPPPDFKKEIYTDLAWGWYLRGDIGYRWGAISSAERNGVRLPTDNDVSGVFWGGVGAGFKSYAIRTDATVDFASSAKYSGTDSAGTSAISARVQSINTLLNFYYDIGTWSRITPYVGAGVGFAYLRTSDYREIALQPLTSTRDHVQWNLAWAVMAGASYQLLPSLSLDTGYRYLNQGDVEIAPDAPGGLTLKGLAAHEFRIGLRWMYDVPSAYIR